jgi:hypothetical protein
MGIRAMKQTRVVQLRTPGYSELALLALSNHMAVSTLKRFLGGKFVSHGSAVRAGAVLADAGVIGPVAVESRKS